MTICIHYGTCGGCSLQHLDDATYAAHKIALLRDALTRAGYPDAPIAQLARTPPYTRRRTDLAVRRHGPTIIVGLHASRSKDVLDLAECHVLHPDLFAIISPLRTVLRSLAALRHEASAIANLLDNGIDLLLRTDADLTAGDRTRLAIFAAAHNIARISWARGTAPPETACLLRPAILELSGVPVTPPPGAFLQASREGEAAIAAAVLGALPAKLTGKSRIADLYAGSGTLTFALARHARVTAYEGDPDAATSLRTAANAHGNGRIEAIHRDLARQPLQPAELSKFAAIVLDPPQDGAPAQMPTIAASGVPRVIYVSCNPAALARDARLLHRAGYTLLSATPVDQFLWSSRLESVVAFSRDRDARRSPSPPAAHAAGPG